MTVRTALRALGRNKLRSALTTLGIVIGVAAVIAMVSIGRGANVAVRQEIESLGTNLLMVLPGATTTGGVRSGWGARTLTVADAAAIRTEAASVGQVAWIKRSTAQVVHSERNWATSVQGVPPSYGEVRNWDVVAGRFFNEAEETAARRVAVIGRTVAEQLFGPGVNPLDATIRVNNVPFRVIGLLARKGQTSWGQDQDDAVLMPFSTAERRVIGTEFLGSVDMIFANAASAAEVPAAREEIASVLRQRHRIARPDDDDFTVRDLNEMTEASRNASRLMTSLLLAVASISLVVGGIGIMNILLVSVTERTREIGVRMAVGAKARHILLQFLVEATALSLVGGLVGAALGVGIARLVSALAGWPTEIPLAAVAGSVLFSAAVGVFFGFYPARKAARLDPIAALRYE